MKIYVGNLSPEVSENDLRREFEVFGKVDTVNIIKDRYSGQPRGFGFVEMPDKTEGQAAITGLKGKMINSRTLDVNEAHQRPAGGRGGGFRGGAGRRPSFSKRGPRRY